MVNYDPVKIRGNLTSYDTGHTTLFELRKIILLIMTTSPIPYVNRVYQKQTITSLTDSPPFGRCLKPSIVARVRILAPPSYKHHTNTTEILMFVTGVEYGALKLYKLS